MIIEYKIKNETSNFIEANLIYEDEDNIYLSGAFTIHSLYKKNLDYLLIKGV